MYEARPKSPPKSDSNSKENAMSGKIEALTIQEDVKENDVEDEEGLTLYPYDRLTTVSSDPAADIDVTKREVLFAKKIVFKELYDFFIYN